jgi:hypothetical protein
MQFPESFQELLHYLMRAAYANRLSSSYAAAGIGSDVFSVVHVRRFSEDEALLNQHVESLRDEKAYSIREVAESVRFERFGDIDDAVEY